MAAQPDTRLRHRGVAGLAFFTFFVLMLWGIAIGVWLVLAGRRAPVNELVAQPSV